MDEQEFPAIPPDLMEALEERFPEQCPDPRWSDREVWMSVGERRVVRFLRSVYDEQQENIMEARNV